MNCTCLVIISDYIPVNLEDFIYLSKVDIVIISDSIDPRIRSVNIDRHCKAVNHVDGHEEKIDAVLCR